MAASDYSDYRLVLCPDFIERAGRKDLVRQHIDPAFDGGAETLRRADVNDDQLGSLSLYYNVIRLKRDGGDAYDPSGRPLLRIQGIVARNRGGTAPLASGEAARLIAESAAEIDRAFEAFWAGKERAPVGVSAARGTTLPPAPEPAPRKDPKSRPLPEDPTRPHRSSAANIVLIGALAVSLLVNAVLAWKGFRRGSDSALIAAELGKTKAALMKAKEEIARLKKKAGEQSAK